MASLLGSWNLYFTEDYQKRLLSFYCRENSNDSTFSITNSSSSDSMVLSAQLIIIILIIMNKFYIVLVSDINHFYFHNNFIDEEAKGHDLPKNQISGY